MGLGAFLVKGVKMSESKTLAAAAPPPPMRSVATKAKATENDAAGAKGAAGDAKGDEDDVSWA